PEADLQQRFHRRRRRVPHEPRLPVAFFDFGLDRAAALRGGGSFFARSRSASLPTHREAASAAAGSRPASPRASARSPPLRLPIPRSAQLTPFLTKLRSSEAAFSMSERHLRNAPSSAVLSRRATEASSANDARLPNSSARRDHCSILSRA